MGTVPAIDTPSVVSSPATSVETAAAVVTTT
jgi:hypothetical protein